MVGFVREPFQMSEFMVSYTCSKPDIQDELIEWALEEPSESKALRIFMVAKKLEIKKGKIK